VTLGYLNAERQLWTAVAERSGDTAFSPGATEPFCVVAHSKSAVAAALCRRSP